MHTYWWKPFQSLRTSLASVRDDGSAWLRLATGKGVGVRNFGDALAEQLVPELFAKKAIWAPPERADLIVVGSVLNTALKKGFRGTVFGAGVRDPDSMIPNLTVRCRMLGVRGHLSAAALGLTRDSVIGDPGLVASEIFPKVRQRRQYPAVLPHFGAFGTPQGRDTIEHFRRLGYHVIRPSLSPPEVARTIQQATHLVTSSLHGMVFGHSFGVPVRLIRFPSGAHAEPSFKYDDYCSVLNLDLTIQNAEDFLKGAHSSANDEDDALELASEISLRAEAIKERIYARAKKL